MSDTPKCERCGEPMPQGEEVFKYHGYSGPCPKPPLAKEPEAAFGTREEMIARYHMLEGLLAEKEAALAVCVGALRMLENSDCRAIGKIDKCAHGKYGYEDCETCFSDFACTVLTSLPQSTKQDGK